MPDAALRDLIERMGAPKDLLEKGTMPEADPPAGAQGERTGVLGTVERYLDPSPAMERAADVGLNVAETVGNIPGAVSRAVGGPDLPGFKGSKVDEALRSYFDRPPAPDETWGPFKRAVGTALPFMAGPVVSRAGLQGVVGPMGPRLPSTLTAAPATTPGAALSPATTAAAFKYLGARSPAALKAAHAAPQVAERAAMGGVVGASENPADRTSGAVAGAIGSLAPGIAGALMKSAGGRQIVSHLAAHGLIATGAHALPGGSWLIAAHGYHFAPGGHRRISRFGHLIFDPVGRFVGRVPEVIGRMTGGSLADFLGSISPHRGTMERTDVNGQENRQNPSVQSQEE